MTAQRMAAARKGEVKERNASVRGRRRELASLKEREGKVRLLTDDHVHGESGESEDSDHVLPFRSGDERERSQPCELEPGNRFKLHPFGLFPIENKKHATRRPT